MAWRDTVTIHPEADKYPLLSPADLQALADDIKKHGLKHPVRVILVGASSERNPEVMVIDGRNRLDALELNGERLCFKKNGRLREFYATGKTCFRIIPESEAVTYVVSANLHRRHLTAEQKRDLIAKLLKAQPESSDRAIAKTVKVDNKTVAAVRTKLESTEEIPQLDKTVGADGKSRKQPSKRPSNKPERKSELQAEASKATTAEPALLQPSNDAESSAEQRKAEYAESESNDHTEEAERWQLSLSNMAGMAGDAIALPASWTRQFGKWQDFPVPSDVVTLAQQAAETWATLARQLAERANASNGPDVTKAAA